MSNKQRKNKKVKKPQPARRVLSVQELQSLCDEQISFLLNSSYRFDEGNTSEAKILALVIRKLVYDSGASKSLFGQLGIKTTFFDSSQNPPEITTGEVTKIMSPVSLVGRLSGNPKHYYSPHFGDPEPEKMLNFEDWWNQTVIIDNDGNIFSRKDIILVMANQDGGAHVDSELDEMYYKLTRLNSVEDKFVHIKSDLSGQNDIELLLKLMNSPSSAPPISPAFYTVRQIAHEVLVSRLKAKSLQFPTIYPYNQSHYSGLSTAYLFIHTEEIE